METSHQMVLLSSSANNNGSPDGKMVKSDILTQTQLINDFREYKFSIDNLPHLVPSELSWLVHHLTSNSTNG